MCDHQNSRDIFPGDLQHGGLCYPIGIDIFATCDERHGTHVHGVGEDYSGNLFVLLFPCKIEISPTHHRNLKYNFSQEISPRPTRPRDISPREIPKFAMYKRQADLSRNRGEQIFNCRSPSGTPGRNT